MPRIFTIPGIWTTGQSITASSDYRRGVVVSTRAAILSGNRRDQELFAALSHFGGRMDGVVPYVLGRRREHTATARANFHAPKRSATHCRGTSVRRVRSYVAVLAALHAIGFGRTSDCGIGVSSAAADPPPAQATLGSSAEPPRPSHADADRLRALGIRSLTGKHLTLFTDLPSSPAVDQLPHVFDLAIPQWCEYFQVPHRQAVAWRLTGYLMKDKERFRGAGLLPGDLPSFLHGYQRGNELWLYDQPGDYYRRHLLLHEGTHGFMKAMLDGVGPPWYAEGTAELLGTHRWQDGKLELGYFPADKREVPHWGRVKLVKDEMLARRGMMLSQIMRYDARAPFTLQAYGWCWAAATFLDNHPKYRQTFRALAGHARLHGHQFTRVFEDQLRGQRRELDEQWQLFVLNLEYGYDLSRAAVVYAPGRPLPADGEDVIIAADRGWQSTGLRLEAEKTYSISAKGRYQVAKPSKVWWCEPGGITLSYYRGRPLGILLGKVRPDEARPGRAELTQPEPIGLHRVVRPQRSGTLYLRINDSPAKLADNVGMLTVRVLSQ